MMKQLTFSTTIALAFVVHSAAAAEPATGAKASCPPGSWFCAAPPDEQPAPAGQPVRPLQPLPPPDSDEATAEASAPPPAPVHPRKATRPPPPPVVVVQPAEPPPVYDYDRPPPSDVLSRRREWGVTARLEGALIGGGYKDNAGMWGGGFGLRFKPVRAFALETDLDFLGGRDYQGFQRNESAFSANALFFANPQSRAALYFLVGMGWSWAHAVCDFCSGSTVDNHYVYFGGQAGIGLEARVSRSFAFDVDLRGFVRGRVDKGADSQPEFVEVDASGNERSTNASGGGLITAGMTLYF
jgi:hypothetical protein